MTHTHTHTAPHFSHAGFSTQFLLVYVDCLRGALRDDIAGTNLTCTLPWTQSMLGDMECNASNKATCNNFKNYDALFNLGFNFSNKIATYDHSKCPGNFKIIIYKIDGRIIWKL